MPPKKGINTKVASAKEKQAALDAQRDAAKAAEAERKEAAEWAKGADARGAGRAAQAEAKAAEAQRKAAEKARLQAEDEAALAAVKPKGKAKAKAPALKPWEAALAEGSTGKKKTRFQLEQEREAERKAKEEAAVKAGEVVVDDSEIMENTNRMMGEQWASGLDGALQELSIGKGPGSDKFPEKRMKAAYRAYEEANLPVMREEKPGLKLSQYKQLIFKSWQSSPENPMNQVP
eukprot:TRINITY_DN7608_c0_g1_i1.p1 TRINITY_DN7608_c0_g1~~TRINITY_DN7608_c0_g1_i1.p1  ORF type:complete len:260 (+),score=78.76 TRINITY_DN7608_c0_g1_i1:84-782(+)